MPPVGILWPDVAGGLRDMYAVAPSQIDKELPCHATRASAPGGLPFDGLGAQDIGVDGHTMSRAIPVNHRKVFILIAGMETQPQAEPVRERDFFLDRL